MTDIEIAKRNLEGHSICLCKNGEFFTDDGRGISPMMRFISQGRDLDGYSAADVIVGKAAAMLLSKYKIKTGFCTPKAIVHVTEIKKKRWIYEEDFFGDIH